jgi:hypothetical protein
MDGAHEKVIPGAPSTTTEPGEAHNGDRLSPPGIVTRRPPACPHTPAHACTHTPGTWLPALLRCCRACLALAWHAQWSGKRAARNPVPCSASANGTRPVSPSGPVASVLVVCHIGPGKQPWHQLARMKGSRLPALAFKAHPLHSWPSDMFTRTVSPV